MGERMKIIKQGTLPGGKKYRATCNNCKTKFEFAAGEARLIFDQRDGDFYAIACPLCSLTVNVAK